MSDPYASSISGLESPATHLIEVVPSDTVDLSVSSRALNVAASGSVRVTTVGGDTATVAIAAGSTMPIRVRRVWSTGTTATGIVAMY